MILERRTPVIPPGSERIRSRDWVCSLLFHDNE